MMKFTSTILTLSLALSSTLPSALGLVVPAPDVEARAGAPGDRPCSAQRAAEGVYLGGFSQACVGLVDECISKLNATESQAIWSEKSCVAAATCDGMLNVYDLAAFCSTIPKLINPSSLPSLDYSIYTSIIGCTNESESSGQCGGAITKQNYIDFLYSTLEDIGSDVWPESDQIDTWWSTITNWTVTGDVVPYMNFNDWLHYSSRR